MQIKNSDISGYISFLVSIINVSLITCSLHDSIWLLQLRTNVLMKNIDVYRGVTRNDQEVKLASNCDESL